MKRRSNLLLYLLLNIIVSAATILIVLVVWNKALPSSQVPAAQPDGLAAQPAPSTAPVNAAAVKPTIAPPLDSGTQPPPGLTETLPPLDQPVIQIISVVGAGDVTAEVVLLKRTGEGNLRMAGWKLQGEHANTYTFPNQPELILFKGGAVQVFSKAGTDAATEVYWNRDKPAWRTGELVRLLDPQGGERATYRIP